MEKQIEEMAKDVCANCMDEICASGRCEFQYDCPLDMDTVKRLYLKGYRKASDVAREIFAEIDTMKLQKDFTSRSQDFEFGYMTALIDIAELKKKYESEGENR